VEASTTRKSRAGSPLGTSKRAQYADAIVRAISGAKTFVLVLSESAIASSHVSKEIERASSKSVRLLRCEWMLRR